MKCTSVLVALALLSVVDADAPQKRSVHRSPDGTLKAWVVSRKQDRYGLNPSRIEIRNRKGRLLAERDHGSYPNQGLTVDATSWTKDSRFFVYSAEQSGGHQPWHHPTFFYSRLKKRFYSLDESIGGAITDSFKLQGPHTIVTEGRFYRANNPAIHTHAGSDNGSKILFIDLGILEKRLTPAMVSSDRKDAQARREEIRDEQRH